MAKRGDQVVMETSALLPPERRSAGAELSCRSKVWTILHFRSSIEHQTLLHRLSYAVELFILNLILVNVFITIWASVDVADPSTQLINQEWYLDFLVFSMVIFTIEYSLRLWSCVEDPRFVHFFFGRLRWMMYPMSVVDLVSLIPFLMEFFTIMHSGNSYNDYSYRGAMSIRALRLLRLVSFFRIERSYNSMKKLRQILTNKKEELGVIIFLTMMMILISSTVIFFVENRAQPKVFSNIGVGAWWTVITITSVGYGDVVPVTDAGRLFGSFVALCGIVLFSVPGAVIGSGFVEVMLQHQQEKDQIEQEKILDKITFETEILKQTLTTPAESSTRNFDFSNRSIVEENSASFASVSSDSNSSNNQIFQSHITSKLNELVENQRILDVQLKQQQKQLDVLLSMLQSKVSSLN